MRKWVMITLVVTVVLVMVTACGPKADHDIRGTWDYTMLFDDGNTYDEGAITFTGSPEKGTYLQSNIYDVEYEGTYTVNGAEIKVSGDESWQGILNSATQMGGTWVHEGEASGTWEAVKQSP